VNRPPLITLFLALAGTCWLQVGCSRPAQEIARPRNVLLISIDTCRADYLGCYGHAGGITPNIDAVAGEAVVFDNAYSPVPLTLPAHASLFTGKLPPAHGVRANIDDRLAASEVTLSEVLREHGLVTGAVVSTLILGSQFGLDQGFDTYEDVAGAGDPSAQRPAAETTRLAVDWLGTHGRDPFFLFVHYYDPHAPYNPPEPFAGRWAQDRYAGEIAYVDHAIGELLAELKALGQYDSTLIVITSDHGEMLGEHGEETHGYFVYQSAVRVPLVVKPAGGGGSRRIARLAGLVDVAPTVLAQLNIETPPDVAGEDLSGWLTGARPDGDTRDPIYCESMTPTVYGANPLLGVVTERFKYIDTTRPELYDIVADPTESHDLIDTERNDAELLGASLADVLEGQAGPDDADSAQLDDEQRSRLESLGYVSGTGVERDLGMDPAREDPKDLIGFHVQITLLPTLAAEGRHAEAAALGDKLLRERPDYARGHFDVAELALRQGDRPRAVRHYSRAIEIEPGFFRAHLRLAVLLRSERRLDEAVGHLRRAVEIEPDRTEAHGLLGLSLAEQGRFDEAVVQFREVLRLDPDDARARSYLAEALSRMEQPSR